MVLYLGQETSVNMLDVVGVFDLDTTTISKSTRDFLSQAEKEKKVINTSFELPKSFVVTSQQTETVYISQLNTQTLQKRLVMGGIQNYI